MLLAAALGLATVAIEPQAVAGRAYRKADLERMTTRELAKALLPPDRAEVVASHSLRSGLFPGGNYDAVEFLSVSRSIDGKFCARQRYFVSLRPAAGINQTTLTTDAPAEANNLHFSDQIALAADCADARGYAHLNSGDIIMAMELLSYLAELRERARRSAELPLKANCATDLDDDSCKAGAIARLANLQIEQAISIERPSKLEGGRWMWRISIPEIPGAVGPYAEVNLNDAPSCATEIEIRRKIPAPF